MKTQSYEEYLTSYAWWIRRTMKIVREGGLVAALRPAGYERAFE